MTTKHTPSNANSLRRLSAPIVYAQILKKKFSSLIYRFFYFSCVILVHKVTANPHCMNSKAAWHSKYTFW